jgi:hypothetical protein
LRTTAAAFAQANVGRLAVMKEGVDTVRALV